MLAEPTLFNVEYCKGSWKPRNANGPIHSLPSRHTSLGVGRLVLTAPVSFIVRHYTEFFYEFLTYIVVWRRRSGLIRGKIALL